MPHHYRVWADEPSASNWLNRRSGEPNSCYSHTINRRAIEMGNHLRLSFNTTIGNVYELIIDPKMASGSDRKKTLAGIFDNSLNNKYGDYFSGKFCTSEYQDFKRFYDALQLWQLANLFISMEHQDDDDDGLDDVLSSLKAVAHIFGIRSLAPYNDIRSARQLVRRLHFEWRFLRGDEYDGELNFDVITSKILSQKVFYTLITSLPSDETKLNLEYVGLGATQYWRYYTGTVLFGPVCLFLDTIFKCEGGGKERVSTNDCKCRCSNDLNTSAGCAPKINSNCKSEYIRKLEEGGKLRFNWHNSLLDRGSSAKFVSNGHKIRVHKQYFDSHHIDLASLRQSVIAKNRRWLLEGDDNSEVFAGSPSDMEISNVMRSNASDIDAITSAMKWRIDEYDYMESVCQGEIPATKCSSDDYLHAYSVAIPAIESAVINLNFGGVLGAMSKISRMKKDDEVKILKDGFSYPQFVSLLESPEQKRERKLDKSSCALRSAVGFFALLKVMNLFTTLAANIGFKAVDLIKHQSHNVPFRLSNDCEMPLQSNLTLLVKR